jgi:hypothetical protein
MILIFLEFDNRVKFPNGSHNVPLNSQWASKCSPTCSQEQTFGDIMSSYCACFILISLGGGGGGPQKKKKKKQFFF